MPGRPPAPSQLLHVRLTKRVELQVEQEGILLIHGQLVKEIHESFFSTLRRSSNPWGVKEVWGGEAAANSLRVS